MNVFNNYVTIGFNIEEKKKVAKEGRSERSESERSGLLLKIE